MKREGRHDQDDDDHEHDNRHDHPPVYRPGRRDPRLAARENPAAHSSCAERGAGWVQIAGRLRGRPTRVGDNP